MVSFCIGPQLYLVSAQVSSALKHHSFGGSFETKLMVAYTTIYLASVTIELLCLLGKFSETNTNLDK